jgi:hypothetical protein
MAINYALFKNNLIESTSKFFGKVLSKDSVGTEGIAERMLAQGSTITRSDIYAVIEDLIKAVEAMLLDGKRVNIGDFIQLYPGLKGQFSGIDDSFDRSRHKIVVRATPGVRLRKTIESKANVKRVEKSSGDALLYYYIDSGSGTRNETITPGNIGSIMGKRLTFNAEEADEGIYFIAEDNTETKVTIVQKNKPSELVFLVPPGLAAGTYRLVIRNRQFTDKLNNTEIDQTLTVN